MLSQVRIIRLIIILQEVSILYLILVKFLIHFHSLKSQVFLLLQTIYPKD